MKRAVAGLVLGVWVQAALAQSISFFNGNQLLAACGDGSAQSLTNTANGQFCMAYISSAVDTHNAWVGWGDIEKQMCVPHGVTQGQLARVVVKYMGEKPEKLHETASSTVLNALMLAFPCK